MRGHITTSALVLDAGATHALLVHHRTFDAWLQPGGHYEPPGSLWASACREVAEETGLRALRAFAADDEREPLDIDTHPIAAHSAKREAAHRHHDFAYLAIAGEAFHPTPQVAEVHAARWVPLEEVLRYPNARLRRVARKAARLMGERERA
jgi:8-oxo-dGTP pyrophosphatase MutT (NUDIX family)